MVLPSGDINGEPRPLRLIHFSKETEAFFWANNCADNSNKTGMKRRCILFIYDSKSTGDNLISCTNVSRLRMDLLYTSSIFFFWLIRNSQLPNKLFFR